jgi:hypothetical protein
MATMASDGPHFDPTPVRYPQYIHPSIHPATQPIRFRFQILSIVFKTRTSINMNTQEPGFDQFGMSSVEQSTTAQSTPFGSRHIGCVTRV